MGLPIWRDPEESSSRKDVPKLDSTAPARSTIRRRPSIHGRSRRPRVFREASLNPVRLERTSDHPFLRELRSSEQRGVPPVSTLLESADRRRPDSPLPPFTDLRNTELQALDARERELRNSIAELHDRHAQLDREARAIEESLTDTVPSGFGSWSEEERLAWVQNHVARRSSSPASPVTEDQPSRVPVIARLRREARRRASRPQSRPRSERPRSNLPTPPGAMTEEGRIERRQERIDHRRALRTLDNFLRSTSPVNGLGDRNRSPTPADNWEIMRSTIAPDTTLPSADSSFTSAAAATQSFGSNSTATTENERDSSTNNSLRNSADDSQSDSVSSVDPDDLLCNEEEREETAAFAMDMFFYENGTPAGRARIARHREAQSADGNRYALSGENEWVEIGFRLINEALDNEEGRETVFRLTQNRSVDGTNFEDWIFGGRREGRRTRRAHITDDEAPSPHPERYSSNAREAVRRAADQVQDYVGSYSHWGRDDGAPSYSHWGRADEAPAEPVPRVSSPPPRYEPLASHPDVNSFTSREPPEAHPVSPPNARSRREVADALLSGDEQDDLNDVRRIVERLAQRDDVPDEWWMSMGLNLSRTRVRSRSPARRSQRTGSDERVNTGRVERRNSHL